MTSLKFDLSHCHTFDYQTFTTVVKKSFDPCTPKAKVLFIDDHIVKLVKKFN